MMNKPTIPTWIRHDDGREIIVETVEEYEKLVSEGWWVTRNDRAKRHVNQPAIEQPSIPEATIKPQKHPGRPKKK